MIESLPPGVILILGAAAVPFLKGRALQGWMLLLPCLGLAQLIAMPMDHSLTLSVFGDLSLELIRADRLSRIFGYIFYIATIISVIFALHVKDKVECAAALVYTGSAIGAAFVGDLISLFVFWEFTAISSVFLIWARGGERATKVGQRYLIIQVLSGVLLLFGAIVHYHQTSSIAFVDFIGPGRLLDSPGKALILLSFGIKAAFPFLHNWLQDAYPEATVTGTVFLSAFTTKLAIYALCRGFAGLEMLVPIGAVMACFPIVFAVIENDLRRVLAYSLNNQLGYMVVGIGVGTELAQSGVAAHAFVHILYKGLLFMSMGAVLHRVGTIKASELGGLYKSMPKTAIFACIGSLSMGAPLFSGFVAKSITLAAVAEGHYTLTFVTLLIAGAGVMLYPGIKVPYFAFWGRDSAHLRGGKQPEEAPTNMLIAMGIAACFCVGIGVYPQALYALLPHDIGSFWPYDVTHVVTQMQLLIFAPLAFVVLLKLGLYPRELRSTNLDSDWIYRRLLPAIGRVIADTWRGVEWGLRETWRSTRLTAGDWLRHHYSPGGTLGEPWPTGSAALWAAILLVAYLVMAWV